MTVKGFKRGGHEKAILVIMILRMVLNPEKRPNFLRLCKLRVH